MAPHGKYLMRCVGMYIAEVCKHHTIDLLQPAMAKQNELRDRLVGM